MVSTSLTIAPITFGILYQGEGKTWYVHINFCNVVYPFPTYQEEAVLYKDLAKAKAEKMIQRKLEFVQVRDGGCTDFSRTNIGILEFREIENAQM